MKVDPAGAPSQTDWRVAGRAVHAGRPIAWLELRPLTGRTHQLRVHCAAMGWPILGDSVYGAAPRDSSTSAPPRLHLLARQVVVPLSKNNPAISVEAPAPSHMLAALSTCGFGGNLRAGDPGSEQGAPGEGG